MEINNLADLTDIGLKINIPNEIKNLRSQNKVLKYALWGIVIAVTVGFAIRYFIKKSEENNKTKNDESTTKNE